MRSYKGVFECGSLGVLTAHGVHVELCKHLMAGSCKASQITQFAAHTENIMASRCYLLAVLAVLGLAASGDAPCPPGAKYVSCSSEADVTSRTSRAVSEPTISTVKFQQGVLMASIRLHYHHRLHRAAVHVAGVTCSDVHHVNR